MAFTTNHPDEATWQESYAKEYKGLIDHNTFDIISKETYLESRKRTGRSAIPSMDVFTVKNDSDGKPVCANPELSPSEIKIPLNGQKQNAMLPLSHNQLFDSLPHLQFRTIPH
jgi:hypothetical protein